MSVGILFISVDFNVQHCATEVHLIFSSSAVLFLRASAKEKRLLLCEVDMSHGIRLKQFNLIVYTTGFGVP
eukprot:m.141505 g.141505  ORF g.141505 m.141505 type:complete len:71 (-) comp17671_c1_seq16:388-600(-)